MKTWKIVNGDVAKTPRGRVDLIEGPNKIGQDLRGWIMNRLGYNKWHPYMGSDIDNFVGQPITPKLMQSIKDTVRNALNDYMEEQMTDLRLRIEERGEPYTAIQTAQPSSIVKSWTELRVTEDYGNITVRVGFVTFTNDVQEVSVTLDNGLATRRLGS